MISGVCRAPPTIKYNSATSEGIAPNLWNSVFVQLYMCIIESLSFIPLYYRMGFVDLIMVRYRQLRNIT